MSTRLDRIKNLNKQIASSFDEIAIKRRLRCPSSVGMKVGQRCIFNLGHEGECMAVKAPELPRVMLRMTGSTMLFDVAIRPDTP